MTIDEAILHCEEKAKIQDEDGDKWEYTLKVYKRRSDWDHTETIKQCRESLNKCRKCAEDYRQLAAWLRELKELRKEKEMMSDDRK